ncbi:MAG: DUF5667 domain-containing protein [Candidatus Staskawiczbacteria bacterium]|nr:DUF5667 domain-containing protein [Candidatus Staskawiczbacteria bacterium]
MFNPIKKYFRQAKQTRLDETKKNSIRESVLMFIEENPAPIIPRNTLGLFSVKLKPAYITIFSLVLVLVVAGAVSAQAGSALPGDPLYPVKVGVNEKVLQVLAFSDDAKTKLSVQLAETRLQEAEKLVVEGKMTTSTQAEIGSNFNVQADVVSKAIDKLNKTKNYNGAQKVASDFEASLKAHSQVLEKIKEIKDSKASGSNNAEKIRQKVNDEIQKIRDKIKTKTPVDNSGSLCGASENTIVTKVIDGDTIVVEGGFHVRLLGMDADEKGYPCYEPASRRFFSGALLPTGYKI